jgi:hypothetical protein
MSNLCDKIRHDVEFRKEVVEKAGLGFELPSNKPVVGPNAPLDCSVDRVTATFTGRIDSVSKELHAAHLKQSPNEKHGFKGFGQMGLFDAQLVVG